MKKNLFFIIIILILGKINVAQCVKNGITTNPSAPVNTQLPSKKNLYFDWRLSNYNNNSTCQPLTSIQSPFYRTDNLEILRLSKDMKVEDGWELLRRDLGYTDQNTVKPEAPEHTYIILYNKFTGVLRIILKTCRNADYNGAKITIRFDATTSFQSSLLDLTSTPRFLDQTFVQNPSAQSASVFVNDQTKWFYADFPMAYDPCTCKYSSKVNIISQMIQTSQIELQGTITGTITSITNGSGTVKDDGSYSFKNFANDADKFKKGYATVDKFITETKNVANTLPNAANTVAALTNLQNALKNSSVLKTGLAAVPWITTAVSVLDFFSGGGKAAPQVVQLMPMAVNLSMKVNGTMTTANQYHNIIFTNPGSLNASADPANYPFYNEILGVFNWLNAPVMSTRLMVQPIPGQGVVVQTFVYKLKQQLKWVLNPASNLQVQDAKIAYVVQSLNTSTTVPTTLPIVGISASTPNASQGFDFYEGKDAITGRNEYRTEYVNFGCLGNEHRFIFTRGNVNATVPTLPILGDFFVKIIVNLKRLDDPNAQNVLLVVKYPLKLESITTTPTGSVFNPTTCGGGMIAQATGTEINNFCASSTYTANRLATGRFATNLIEASDKPNSISISPNPTSNAINIQGSINGQMLQSIQIINSLGIAVYQEKVNIANFVNKTISLTNFSNGNYFIKLNYISGKSESKKITVAH